MNLEGINFTGKNPGGREPRVHQFNRHKYCNFFPSNTADPELPGEAESLLRFVGVDVTAYRSNVLQRRLPACLRTLGVNSVGHALELVKRRPDYADRVKSAVLLGVSGFFRDPEVWEDLRLTVVPELKKRGAPLSVLSAGCSNGQELYSLTMLTAEAGLLNTCLFLGLDCREEAVAAAQAGSYSGVSVLDIAAAYRRFVIARGENLEVAPWLRWHVSWKQADLLKFKDSRQWDIILFRNVSIYLKDEQSLRIYTQLTEALRPGGILVTGKAERPPRSLAYTRIRPNIYRRDGQ